MYTDESPLGPMPPDADVKAILWEIRGAVRMMHFELKRHNERMDHIEKAHDQLHERITKVESKMTWFAGTVASIAFVMTFMKNELVRIFH